MHRRVQSEARERRQQMNPQPQRQSNRQRQQQQEEEQKRFVPWTQMQFNVQPIRERRRERGAVARSAEGRGPQRAAYKASLDQVMEIVRRNKDCLVKVDDCLAECLGKAPRMPSQKKASSKEIPVDPINRGWIYCDGMLIVAPQEWTRREQVQDYLMSKEVSVATCIGAQQHADPDNATKRTNKFFVKPRYTEGEIERRNMLEWGVLFRSIRETFQSGSHMFRFDITCDILGSFYVENPEQALRRFGNLFEGHRENEKRPVYIRTIVQSPTCITWVWLQDGASLLGRQRDYQYLKKLVVYNKGWQMLRKQKGDHKKIDHGMCRFYAGDDLFLDHMFEHEVQQSGLTRIECKYYFHNADDEQAFFFDKRGRSRHQEVRHDFISLANKVNKWLHWHGYLRRCSFQEMMTSVWGHDVQDLHPSTQVLAVRTPKYAVMVYAEDVLFNSYFAYPLTRLTHTFNFQTFMELFAPPMRKVKVIDCLSGSEYDHFCTKSISATMQVPGWNDRMKSLCRRRGARRHLILPDWLKLCKETERMAMTGARLVFNSEGRNDRKLHIFCTYCGTHFERGPWFNDATRHKCVDLGVIRPVPLHTKLQWCKICDNARVKWNRMAEHFDDYHSQASSMHNSEASSHRKRRLRMEQAANLARSTSDENEPSQRAISTGSFEVSDILPVFYDSDARVVTESRSVSPDKISRADLSRAQTVKSKRQSERSGTVSRQSSRANGMQPLLPLAAQSNNMGRARPIIYQRRAAQPRQ